MPKSALNLKDLRAGVLKHCKAQFRSMAGVAWQDAWRTEFRARHRELWDLDQQARKCIDELNRSWRKGLRLLQDCGLDVDPGREVEEYIFPGATSADPQVDTMERASSLPPRIVALAEWYEGSYFLNLGGVPGVPESPRTFLVERFFRLVRGDDHVLPVEMHPLVERAELRRMPSDKAIAIVSLLMGNHPKEIASTVRGVLNLEQKAVKRARGTVLGDEKGFVIEGAGWRLAVRAPKARESLRPGTPKKPLKDRKH